MSPPKRNRIGFFYRRLIAVVAINVLPLLLLSALLYSNIIVDYRSNLIKLMSNQIILLASTSESALLFDDAEAGESVLSSLELNESARYAQIYNADGQLFAQYTRPGIIIDAVIEDFDKAVSFKENNIYLKHSIVKSGESLGFIVMSASTEDLADQKESLLLLSITILLGSFILASLLNWTLQKRLNTPIRDLIGLVHYVTESKRYHKRLDIDQNNEFGDLIADVNTMLNTLELQESERKAAAAQIIQASKLATLGEMATSVAHELNQPLNVIRMAAGNSRRRISKGTADTEYLNDKLKRIEEQTARAAAIIDHMRMFGREAKEELEPINPRTVVTNALDLMGEQLRLADIEIVTELAEDCPSILGHIIQLEQVIMNLLTNARDAMAESGGEAKITLRVYEDDEAVHITCEDTGGGIPEDVLPRIFEPFYTTKEMGKGTGLGLSVAYGIVRDMHGTLVVDNINGGARFTITLPIVS
ncbi:MAG: C4-dicarboxylate-specific signal transduction histidine kinase [Porticoccaceae bacterium]|jgi:C4-dicarboxylate-specific signal transduction histidine kinase